MAEPQQKVRLTVPDNFNESDRIQLGELVIEHILERTSQGLDKDNKSFTPYSKSYSGSRDFKTAGKSKSTVDLKLSGDMLASMSLLDHGTGYITVGYESGTEANDKADWAAASDNGPSRQFVGITDKSLELLVKQIAITKEDENERVSRKLAVRILSRLGIGNEN